MTFSSQFVIKRIFREIGNFTLFENISLARDFRQFQSLHPVLVVVSVFLHRDFLAPAVLQIVVDAIVFSDAAHLESIPHLVPIPNRFPAVK